MLDANGPHEADCLSLEEAQVPEKIATRLALDTLISLHVVLLLILVMFDFFTIGNQSPRAGWNDAPCQGWKIAVLMEVKIRANMWDVET